MVQQATRPETTTPAAEPPRLKMTYEEFQAWYTEGRRGEWVDGEVIPFVAPKTIHQQIAWFLATVIGIFCQDRGLGSVLPQPQMRLRDGESYREPDIAFVAAGNDERITAEGIHGPADLVIEIVSEDSVRRDRRDKFNEYAEAGVREYWVIDPRPRRRRLLAYQLSDEGVFDVIFPDSVGRLHSTVVPGFWVDSAWLWQEPLTGASDALRQIEATSVST